jgi:hypothetical protein
MLRTCDMLIGTCLGHVTCVYIGVSLHLALGHVALYLPIAGRRERGGGVNIEGFTFLPTAWPGLAPDYASANAMQSPTFLDQQRFVVGM